MKQAIAPVLVDGIIKIVGTGIDLGASTIKGSQQKKKAYQDALLNQAQSNHKPFDREIKNNNNTVFYVGAGLLGVVIIGLLYNLFKKKNGNK